MKAKVINIQRTKTKFKSVPYLSHNYHIKTLKKRCSQHNIYSLVHLNSYFDPDFVETHNVPKVNKPLKSVYYDLQLKSSCLSWKYRFGKKIYSHFTVLVTLNMPGVENNAFLPRGGIVLHLRSQLVVVRFLKKSGSMVFIKFKRKFMQNHEKSLKITKFFVELIDFCPKL